VLLDALRELGLERDTLVVVTCDHGVEFPRAKSTLYDPGIELPLIVRWPAGGIVGGRRCPWLLSNVDWLPTLLDLVGVAAGAPLHGRSFAGWFDGSLQRPPRDEVHAMYMDQLRMVRTRERKLIWNLQPRRWQPAPVEMGGPPPAADEYPVWEFYDLAHDPIEAQNRSATRAVVHPGSIDDAYRAAWREPSREAVEEERALKERLWRWMEAVGDPLLRGPEVKPYYERAVADYRAARGIAAVA
jgi:arylsulfatase A-like enzyme